MLPVSLALKPGVNTQNTELQNEGGISQANLIRHSEGLVQKWGGCEKLTTSLTAGICRCLFPWEDLSGNAYLAIGTDIRLELFTGGQIVDITPVVQTDDLTGPFQTFAGMSTVTVTDGSYNPGLGSYVNVVNAIYVGGIVLQGIYPVIALGTGTYDIDVGVLAVSDATGGTAVHFSTVNTTSTVTITLGAATFVTGQTLTIGVSTTVGGLTFFGDYNVTNTAGTYTIDAGLNATGTNTGFENAGDARIAYLLELPQENYILGEFGTGPFGAGPFGIGAATYTQNSWTMNKFGQNLVAAYKTGTVYQWVPPVSEGNVAEAVSGAPSNVNGIFTAAPEQQVIAYGIFSSAIGQQDALLVGWCDIADINDWTASATNQAGTFRLSSGSKIVSGMWAGSVGILWTDLDLWVMTYINFPFIYGFNQISRNCGLVGQRGVAIVGAVIEWMSQNDFFDYRGGSVSKLACPVRDFVFNNIDLTYFDAIHADPNSYFGEITWWFPTIGSGGICNAWVRHNIEEDLWDCGPLPAPPLGFFPLEISAWTDQSVFGPPIGTFFDGRLERFESSEDIDGAVFDSWLITGWFQLAQGEEFIFLERILPDFILTGTSPQITVTVYVADYMSGPETTYGPFTVTPTNQYFPIRCRGRVCKLRVDCTAPNTFWRYGKPLAVVAADGRR